MTIPAPPAVYPMRLFVASCVALLATGMTFAVRGDIITTLEAQFHLNNYQLGVINGAAFYGFMLSILFGGALVDALGMKHILGLAFAAHVSGLVLTISAQGFGGLYAGTLIVGVGNGLIEAACNPLIATLFAGDKTRKLNAFHAYFPGGLIAGGLASFALTHVGADWRVKLGVVLVAVAAYGALLWGQRFPQTERVGAGVSTRAMYREAGRSLFLVLLACMFLTAATELGTGQWIPAMLDRVAHAPGILVLVFINAVMFFGRSVAGPLVHRVSPVGVVCVSSVLSALGLFALSEARSPAGAFGAALVFALGVCYYWPTMLGLTSERFPRGGSFLLGLMGAAGNLSTALVVPLIGHINDVQGPSAAFRAMTFLPIILTVVFGTLYAVDRGRGGYRAETLERPLGDEEPLATPL